MAGLPPLQRVSAHVVPKPLADEDEKTTIDPQWDDGSTTREQHKVSKKLQSLGSADRHRGQGVGVAIATLVVTKGPDLGLTSEIHSGKAFTIGRSLDCDVVLTDIAVSRKHFDVRNEDGWWIIADRGSGNGTLVNGDLRNNPFQLVNGDVVEVGTTVLRFDCALTDLESDVSTISGRRPPLAPMLQEPAALDGGLSPGSDPPLELQPTIGDPVAPLGPKALIQMADTRLPRLPTRPLALGPHSPTLLGMDAQVADRAILPPQSISPTESPLKGTSFGATAKATAPSPQTSSRTKYFVVAAAAAVALAAVAFAATRESAPAQAQKPAAQPERPRFTLPVSDLKAAGAAGTIAPKTTGTAGTSGAKPSAPMVAAATPKQATAATPPPTQATSTAPNVPTSQKTVATTSEAVQPKAAVPRGAQKEAPEVVPQAIAAPTAAPIDAVVETKVRPSRGRGDKKSKRAAGDLEAAEDKANSLYRAGKFSEAADALRTYARSADGSTRRTLDSKAASYLSFGKAYVQGMTNNNAVSAFVYLRSATKYDQSLGGAFDEVLTERMKQIAPKAAVAYIAADKLIDARVAVQAAERVGATSDSNVMVVRQKLESAAAKLYAEAMRDLQDNPSEAKEKFRQIKDMVDSKSPWYEKASKQL